MQSFKIVPILGRKVDVPQNDATLFQMVAEGVALTHDVGGLNFDLRRKRNVCTKSQGYVQWSNSANAQATKCLGLFVLDDGTNRDYCYFDNGKFYVFDASLDPADKTKAATTYATDNIDLYSMIRVGAYIVFTDRGETAIQSWTNGDANAADAVSSGTSVKARWLKYFQQRVVAVYTDQTNGDIDIRWTAALPVPQASFVFAAANQLYVPNDDPIAGIATMGRDRCFIYSSDSIHQLDYYPDYTSPFRCYTTIPHHGCVNHHSIVESQNRHYLFNKDYGFVEYSGGAEFPSGRPISDNIEADVASIDSEYYNLIVGARIPMSQRICWSVPSNSSITPNQLWFYDLRTGEWTFEDKPMRFIDAWQMYSSYTWNTLIADYGAIWNSTASLPSTAWGEFLASRQRLAYAPTDGQLYYQQGESIPSGAIDGYRIEPVLDFGNPRRMDFLTELWFEITETGDFSIDISHRSGDTVGEITAQSWTSIGSISCNSPTVPALRNLGKTARLHQIKWGTDADDEKFGVNGIVFKYEPQSEN